MECTISREFNQIMDGRLNVRQISRESYRRRSLRIANAQRLFTEGRLSISLFLCSVTSYENFKNLAVRPGDEEEDEDEEEDDDDEILDINLDPMDDGASEEEYDVHINESLCVICKVTRKEAAFFPCCHFCICLECSVIYRENDTRCPMCRVPYDDIKKMF